MSLPESKRDRRIPIDPAGLRAFVDSLDAKVRDARPVVTRCPICQRSNPCPLHLFAEQVDYNRAHGL